MAWWNRFRKTKVNLTEDRTVEVKGVIGAEGDPIRQFLLFGAQSKAQTPAAALQLYEESTAVSIPINKIAEKFADLTPIIMIDDEKITSHPILDLLNKPSGDFDQELLFKDLAVNYLVTGEAFIVTLGLKGGKALEIYPLTPSNIQHFFVKGFVTGFSVVGEHFPGKYVREDDEFWSNENLRQLTQVRNFSIKNNSMYRGRSKLIVASDNARQQVLGTKHNLSVLEKGGHLSLVFHFDNEMDDDDFQIAKRRVREEFGGPENAGKIGVTAGGKLAVSPLSQTNQDMDWLNSQELSTRVLALTYNLPLPILSIKATTMNNYQVSLEAMYDDAVTPLSKVIFGGLERALFPRFDMPPNARLIFDEDKVPALLRRRMEHIEKRGQLNVESDNEIRNMLGRESYDGGDVMYKPSTQIPVGTDIITDDDLTLDDE